MDNWKITNFKIFPEPATLYAMSPHMHLRGKDMKFILTYPDGREELVLDVPKYDFNWQLYYELATPLKIPAGSKLTAIAHYDNSPKNKWNPAPDQGSVLVRAELGRDVQPADPVDVGSAGADERQKRRTLYAERRNGCRAKQASATPFGFASSGRTRASEQNATTASALAA